LYIVEKYLSISNSAVRSRGGSLAGYKTDIKIRIKLTSQITNDVTQSYIYIALELYPRWGYRGISDIPPRRPRFTKMLSYETTANVTSGKAISSSDRSLSLV
jgi:hypothetical protein